MYIKVCKQICNLHCSYCSLFSHFGWWWGNVLLFSAQEKNNHVANSWVWILVGKKVSNCALKFQRLYFYDTFLKCSCLRRLMFVEYMRLFFSSIFIELKFWMRMTVVNKKTVFVSRDADKFSELLRWWWFIHGIL